MFQFITRSDCKYYEAHSATFYKPNIDKIETTLDILFHNREDDVWVEVDSIVIPETNEPPNLPQMARDWFKSNIPN